MGAERIALSIFISKIQFMKKWKKFLIWWCALGAVGIILDLSGAINLQGRLSKSQEEARATYISDWNRLVGLKADITNDTVIVYVTKEQNPFANPDDFAGEYRPRLVNGQSCDELGVRYIQVRSMASNKMLSGVTCDD